MPEVEMISGFKQRLRAQPGRDLKDPVPKIRKRKLSSVTELPKAKISKNENSEKAALDCHDESVPYPYLIKIPQEIVFKICNYLPIFDLLNLSGTSPWMKKSVDSYLAVQEGIRFCDTDVVNSIIPEPMCRDLLLKIFKLCPNLTRIYGFFLDKLYTQRRTYLPGFSRNGIVTALKYCTKLKGIEVNRPELLDLVLRYYPDVEILGKFHNACNNLTDAEFIPICLGTSPLITHLHLEGVVLSYLPKMPHVKTLFFKWVNFHSPNNIDFSEFSAPNVCHFSLMNCSFPMIPTHMTSQLMNALCAAKDLETLELVRVPMDDGLVLQIIESTWTDGSFQKLKKLRFGGTHISETDVGSLAIASAATLEELHVPPYLSRDSFFIALSVSDIIFSKMEILEIGYIDYLPSSDSFNDKQKDFLSLIAPSVELPGTLTDTGLACIQKTFPRLKKLRISHCPQINNMTSWIPPDTEYSRWMSLHTLQLTDCSTLDLASFCEALPFFHAIQAISLDSVFPKPITSCSGYGLSEGQTIGAFSSEDMTCRLHPHHMPSFEPTNGAMELLNMKAPPDAVKSHSPSKDNVAAASTSASASQDDSGVADLFESPEPRRSRGKQPAKRSNRRKSSTAKFEQLKSKEPPCCICDNDCVDSACPGRSPEVRHLVSAAKTKFVQVMNIKSNTLRFFSMHLVGVTELIIDEECQHLTQINCINCSSLVNISLNKTQKLSQIYTNLCPELNHYHLVDQASKLPVGEDRLVIIQPSKNYEAHLMEKVMFSQFDGYNICLFHDHSKNVQNLNANIRWLREMMRVTSWSNWFFTLVGVSPNIKWQPSIMPKEFPWGRNLYHLQGEAQDGGEWEMLTDVYWMRLFRDTNHLMEGWKSIRDCRTGNVVWDSRIVTNEQSGSNSLDLGNILFNLELENALETQSQPKPFINTVTDSFSDHFRNAMDKISTLRKSLSEFSDKYHMFAH